MRSIGWPCGIVAALLLGCARQPGEGAIAFSLGSPAPGAADVARADIASSRRPGEPQIAIEQQVSNPIKPFGALVSEVDKAIQFAADPRIVAVVGPSSSREALQTAPVYRDAGLPNVVPTATSRLLRAAGPWTFMLAADDSVQGEFIGGFVAERLGSHTALLFYVPDEYGLGLASGVRAALARRKVRLLDGIVVRSGLPCPLEDGDNPYEEVVTAALRAGPPDAVVLATRTSETPCLVRALAPSVQGARFVAGDGTLLDGLPIAGAGPAAASINAVAFWVPESSDTASQSFRARFHTIVGRYPRHDEAMAYDAVMLLATAIRAVGADRSAIRRYLEELGEQRPPYPGVTGPIAFRPGSKRPMHMTRLAGHAIEAVPE
jgi:branched-chain amino acid transport system substrate-binding protein